MDLLNTNRIVNLIEQIDDVIQLDDHGLLESQLNRMKSLLLSIRTRLSYGQTAPIETFIKGFERMENEFRSARILIGKVLDQRDSWQRRFYRLLRNRNVDEFYKKLREDTELKEFIRPVILLIGEILDQQDSWPFYCIPEQLKELMQFEKLKEHRKLKELEEKLLQDVKELKEIKQFEKPKEHTELIDHTELTELEELKLLKELQELKKLEKYTERKELTELKKLIQLKEIKKHTEHTELIQLIIKSKIYVDELYKELKKLSEHTELTELVQTGPRNGEVVVERWLREAPHVRIIGVCGGAGVGKITLLQNVYNRYKVSDFFDVVIWVTVGQSGILELQDCIARAVNLDHTRNIKLLEYLKAKKFLLIFDDISVPLNLQKLGVEFGDDKGSKVICSSRKKDVIEKTWAKCGIYIEPLTREEAWELLCNVAFKDGHLPQHSQHIARQVANECRGLPLAIHVVAATMRGNNSVNDWNLALRQMQTKLFDDDETTTVFDNDDEEALYRILRWSYDILPNANLKSCFLYCAMFPRDHEIEVDKIVGMWIAEGLVKSMDTAHSYIKFLADRCFFQVTHIPHGIVFIKACNPLRDLAIFMGKTEKQSLFKAVQRVQNFRIDSGTSWKRISFYGNNIKNLPAIWGSSNVVSLILGANKELKNIPISNSFPSIRVLDLSRTKLKFLPETLLWSLRTLEYLDVSYTEIEGLSESIGNLSKLQFLNMSGCIELKSLPLAIGHLRKLQFLDVSGCSKLTSIPSVIYELEELKYLRVSQYNAWL